MTTATNTEYRPGTIGHLLAHEAVAPETIEQFELYGAACTQARPCLVSTPVGEYCPDTHRCDCNPALSCGERARFTIVVSDSPATGTVYSHYCEDCRDRVLSG